VRKTQNKRKIRHRGIGKEKNKIRTKKRKLRNPDRTPQV
jgi:hypothetical protein